MSKSSGWIRRGSYQENFVVISRFTAEDKRLSFEARGLLFEILAKPPDWRVLVADLITRSPAGRDKIYRLLNELIKYKYVWRVQYRTSKGRYLPPTYWVYGESQHSPPSDLKYPYPEKPYAALPRTEKTTQTNIHKSKKIKKTTTEDLRKAVEWPDSLNENERLSILDLAKNLDISEFRQVFYELLGRGNTVKNKTGYFYELVKRVETGKFIPNKILERDKLEQMRALGDERKKRMLEESERSRVKFLEENLKN